MQDLSAATFCVPIVAKNSPFAYAIINDIHWYDKVAQHSGVEMVWRYVLKKAYIIEGRSIVKNIKRLCHRCRYLKKKTIEIIMGTASEYSLKIAPAFYITQVHLTGPFKAYSKHNKIWLAVFCCTTTTISTSKLWKTITPLHSFKHLQGFLAKLVIQKSSYQMKEASSSKDIHQ